MKAFVVRESSGALEVGVRDVALSPAENDDVLIRVEYSGVNFKDVMVASAPSRVRRRESLIGGVDASGVVERSSDAAIPPGTRVAVHGGDLGVGRDGGFASHVYAPSRYVSILPPSISTRDAMIIGTAGFTSMASVLALEDHGLHHGGEVVVTGATGGVGSQAVAYLARRGFTPVASTGSSAETAWLVELGANRVIGRSDVSDRPDRVLGSERWDGAVDCVGGETLQQILRSLRYGAAVAASGLVGSAELSTSIYPFITRAVVLIGIDAVETSPATRQRIWDELGNLASTFDFAPLMDREVALEDLERALEDVRVGTTRGRVVINVLTSRRPISRRG